MISAKQLDKGFQKKKEGGNGQNGQFRELRQGLVHRREGDPM